MDLAAAAQDTTSAMASVPASSWVFKSSFYFIAAWLIMLIAFFIISLKKYTFGKWTPENPNPYEKETLGLPRGIFRGALTLSLLFIVIIFEVINLTVEGLEKEYEQLMVAFQMMLAFYFGSKVVHHVTAADERKSEASSAASRSGYPPTDESDFESTGAVG